LAEHGMKQALKQQTQTSGQTPPKAAKKRVWPVFYALAWVDLSGHFVMCTEVVSLDTLTAYSSLHNDSLVMTATVSLMTPTVSLMTPTVSFMTSTVSLMTATVSLMTAIAYSSLRCDIDSLQCTDVCRECESAWIVTMCVGNVSASMCVGNVLKRQ
jgi:hypothetical protein